MSNRTVVFVAALLLGVAATATTAAAAPQAGKQPVMTTLKSDFIPGEKLLFYDDFTDMTPGDPPKRFKARGAAPELQEAGAIRQLTFTQRGLLVPNLTSLPKNFTYETELKLDIPAGWVSNTVVFLSKGKEALTFYLRFYAKEGSITLSTKVPKFEEFGRATKLPTSMTAPIKAALWVQDGRVRVFYEGEKRLDVNQVELPPIDQIEVHSEVMGKGSSIGYRSFRIAESTPDAGTVLGASGRYVSHAINFDTDSDRLKVESGPAIQMIAKALQATPSLKLLIEGHTDASGDAKKNLDLSKRRAEAVKAVLVAQFNIEAARLTTAGLGSTKPIDSNDTPQGRAQNRRVEFVKQ